MWGILVNSKEKPYAKMLANGTKFWETRDSNSLKRFVGQQIGIVESGGKHMYLVGIATIGTPYVFENSENFYAYYDYHKVNPTSKYKFKGKKYCYPFLNVVELEHPVMIRDKSRRSGRQAIMISESDFQYFENRI